MTSPRRPEQPASDGAGLNRYVHRLPEIYMGYKLRRWLAEALPDGLSSGERLVALEIADQAHEDTRRAYGLNLMDAIVRRTGLSDPKQVGKILGKLAAAGVELRVPATDKAGQVIKDKQGRTVYACRGHMLEFRIPQPGESPTLKVPRAEDLNDPKVPLAGELSDPQEEKGPPPGPERSPARGTKVPLAGHPTSHLSSETSLSGRVGPDADVSRAPTIEREIIEDEDGRADPENAAAPPPVETIVSAWTEAYGGTPPALAPNAVRRDARKLLAKGLDPDLLRLAAADMARHGWKNLAQHLEHFTPPAPAGHAPNTAADCPWCDPFGWYETDTGRSARCTHPEHPPAGHPAADTRSAA
jgi:hypothetical protein